jgi:pantetheine-phosphate adenylyltransferase
MKKKLGIYAGSFNPFTIGHLNILQKAERILGKGNILVAIGCNPAKTSITDNSGRAKELSEKIGCEVIAYTTFLHEIILQKEEEGYDVVLIRGLRNGEDLAYEDNQLKFIREFLPENYYLNTIFLMSDEEYKHISSSAVRQLESFRQGSASQYVV